MKRFKFFVFVFAFLICIGSVSASTRTYNRTKDNNYGVNKKWDINSKNLKYVQATPLVDSSEKVYDFADILSDSEEKEIYKKIKNFISAYDVDMVFVTTDFSYSDDIDNEDYAADFYDFNDFGLDYEHYDGIIIYRNAYSSDPYYAIYFFGDVQLYFNSDRRDDLLDDIYDTFHSKKYVSGIDRAISIISSNINSGIPHSNRYMYVDEMGFLKSHYHVPVVTCFVFSSIITFIVILVLVKKNKMVKKAATAFDYLGKDTIKYTEKTDKFIRSHTSSYTVSSSSGGGHSGGGHSGGGHSGGGRHG